MGRFIDCHLALQSWGEKPRYRRAKIGLLRKGSTVFITIFFRSNDTNKFEIQPESVEVLPAIIRFTDLKKDLIVTKPSDEQKYEIMRREIKVILKREQYAQSPKAGTLERLISNIPSYDSFNLKDVKPAKISARIISDVAALNGDGCGYSVGINGQTQQGVDQTQNYNQISLANGLHRQILQNKQLKSIKICGLETVPELLWQRTSLYELYLTESNLTSVPKQLETFANTLTILNLSCNRINNVPRSFCCKMNKLRTLDLSHNQIETLPIEIKFFCRLVDLNISNNHLRMLPSTFSDLRLLRNLNVANNNLSQLPAFRREEIRLYNLDVSHNPLDGALNEANTFEAHPSSSDGGSYNENFYCPLSPISRNNKFPTLFEISMLNIVRSDKLLKLASQESLPRTIVSAMQRDVFKCYICSRMSILPAYNSTDILDYVEHVRLHTTGNYRHGMTFMKLLCRSCFDNMSS